MSEILGLGNDIIEIARIEKNLEEYGKKFLDRLFTFSEQEYCNRYNDSGRHYAGRFAAKEATVKALGTGFGEYISWLDIEILPDSMGKPEVTLSPRAREKFGFTRIILSISHCKTYATAVAIHMKN